MNSFLKWPGGKKWFAHKYSDLFPRDFNKYYEPFLGGGSVFFEISPSRAILSDINDELINLYEVMRDSHKELASSLIKHNEQHCKEYYYYVRGIKPLSKVERAARMLYLNRTCFNGMYRVNKLGKFNVPIGTKTNCIYDIDKFSDFSLVLKDTEIIQSDFSETINRAMKNDLVFADPPYTVSHNQNSFIKYNQNMFSWNDQLRLLDDLIQARDRGAIVIATNAYYSELIELYEQSGFYVTKLERHSNLASNASKRRMTEELLITSYEPKIM